MTQTARTFWILVLLLASIALICRLTIAFTSEPSPRALFEIILMIALMYGLFLLEGLQHCAIQIKDADEDGIKGYIYQEIAPKRKDAILAIVSKLKSSFELFLTGRNICSMISIVLIALLIDKLPDAKSNWVYEELKTVSEKAPELLGSFVHNFIVTFMLSALLPCWFAQLLPQLLADQRSIEFIHMPFASWATSVAIYVARLEAGWPSEMLYLGFRKTGRFASVEKFKIGERAIFERFADLFGSHVIKRKITLCSNVDGLQISDYSELHLELCDTSLDLRHILRLANPAVGTFTFNGWDFSIDGDVTHDPPRNKSLSITTREIGSRSAAGANPQSKNDTVFSFETTFGVQPSETKKAVTAQLAARYAQNPLSLEINEVDRFYVFITKPTKAIEIELEPASNTFFVKPTVHYEITDETSGLSERIPEPKPLEQVTIDQVDEKWTLSIAFPPMHSKIGISLDARKRA